MAEFCSSCSPNFYDWDLFELALLLDNGHSESFICEGCNIRGLYKDEKGLVYLAKLIDGKIELVEVNVEELMV